MRAIFSWGRGMGSVRVPHRPDKRVGDLELVPTPFPAVEARKQRASGDGRQTDMFIPRNFSTNTGGRGRTDTPFREQDFESSASANFATPAFLKSAKVGAARPVCKPGVAAILIRESRPADRSTYRGGRIPVRAMMTSGEGQRMPVAAEARIFSSRSYSSELSATSMMRKTSSGVG